MSGAFLTGLAYVMVRKANNLKESPYVIMFYFPLFTVPLSLVLMGNSWVDPTTEIWIYLFLVGLASQLGQMFLTFGYRLLPASRASITSYVQVPFSVIAGILIFNHSISINFIFGSVIIFSAIILFNEIELPTFVINTTEWLMYATIFLILMSLGIALTRLKVFSLNNAVISSITRMFIGPLIGIGLIWFFDLEGFAAGVLLIQCSMPSAVLNYLVGSIYSPKKVVDSVASTIVVSTLMSFITIPIVVYFALRYFS